MANDDRVPRRNLGERILDVVVCRSCSRYLEVDEVENGGSNVKVACSADHHAQVKDHETAESEGKDEDWARNQ